MLSVMNSISVSNALIHKLAKSESGIVHGEATQKKLRT